VFGEVSLLSVRRIAPARSLNGVRTPESGVLCMHNDYRHLFEAIHNHAYLSKRVTSGAGPARSGVPQKGSSGGTGAPLCKMLHMNFGEFLFHALR
jgi:hypothetical protein